ncbi:sulfonate ABC transporter substrate-binding protein [Amycolatopsis thailandensis]|uniref:Sulfonate ABC transporter substrate-binding protein n=1 Tax=Amycolatopsis thailandensis TaxID=589330 RepID=A0A229RUE7_9PSEU|nr:ABC transporter substrate-binding protein [Amycolatopsis thailandensis]OXM50317.1 sulfonate ABC transporter substrate-binding protein [Amycolatopsis thailandensis]
MRSSLLRHRLVHIGGRVTAGAALLAVTAGCGLLGGDEPAPGPGIPVKVAALALADVAPLHIAIDHGLFAQRGIAVTLIPASSGQDAITKLASGDADIAYAGDIAAVNAVDGGLPLKIVAEAAVAGERTMRVLARQDGPAQSVPDLAGKKLGRNAPGGVSDTLTKSLMADHGADPNSVTWANLEFGAMAAAVKAGDIEAALFPEPFATKAEKEHGLRPIADPATGSAKNFPIGLYGATDAFATANPGAIAGFQRAMRDAAAAAMANRKLVEDTAVKHLKGIDADTAALMELPVYRSDPIITELQRVPDLMRRYGAKFRRPIQMSELIIPPPPPGT